MSIEAVKPSQRPLLAIQRNLDDAFARQASSRVDLSPKLGVRTSDNKAYLLNLEDFDETMMTEDIMNVGRVNSWVKGITSWRGRVFTIIDMSILFECPRVSDNTNVSVFGSILHSKHDKNWALTWSGGTEGLVDVSRFKPIEMDKSIDPWISSILEDENGERWCSLNIEKLLNYEKLSKVL